MNYHDYIWDLGGTLLDNYEVSTQAFMESLAIFGYQGDHDSIYAKLKLSTADAIAYFIPNESRFLSVYKQIEANYLKHPVLFEGAKEVLETIAANGGRQFLVSHRNHQVLTLLEQTEILPYFTEVITSENGFARKPSPEAFLYLKEKYQIQDALVIGDRDIDRQAGQAAGFATLLVEGKTSLMEIVIDDRRNETFR